MAVTSGPVPSRGGFSPSSARRSTPPAASRNRQQPPPRASTMRQQASIPGPLRNRPRVTPAQSASAVPVARVTTASKSCLIF